MTVEVSTSASSPQPVGTVVLISATATDTNAGPVSYRFELQAPGASSFTMLRDYSIENSFSWAATGTDGLYTIRVTARDYLANDYSSPQTVAFTTTSLVKAGVPVVNATAHPLVALFSAPGCGGGARRVSYASGSQATIHTQFVRCTATSMNFLIGGMRASTTYQMHFETDKNGVITADSHVLSFATGAIPATVQIPAVTLPLPPGSNTSSERFIVYTTGVGIPMFGADIQGRTVWYYPDLTADQLTRPVSGGQMLILCEGSGTGTGYWGPNDQKQHLLRLVDLAGNTIRETNVDRVSEQLPASDIPYGLDRFSHEARLLPNGNFLVLAETQAIYPAGTQGSMSPIDLLGAVILVLDPNFQVLWYWNSFDHAGGNGQLDINRAPVLPDNCVSNGASGIPGCPDVLLLPTAVDWLHANALQLLGDGNILLSMRAQDWVAKVDYENGAVASNQGAVDWIMGVGGSFTFVNTTDPYPWFSGQHDPEFQNNQLVEMSVFDDGNTRIRMQGGQSRGQVLSVDESSMTVSFILDVNVGSTSLLLGSAQPLANGNWSFDSGQNTKTATAQTVEVTPQGTFVSIEAVATPVYRSFRMPDFYNVPQT